MEPKLPLQCTAFSALMVPFPKDIFTVPSVWTTEIVRKCGDLFSRDTADFETVANTPLQTESMQVVKQAVL